MIEPRLPVYICLDQGLISQDIPICQLADLYEDDLHWQCGLFMLRRYVHEGQVRVGEGK